MINPPLVARLTGWIVVVFSAAFLPALAAALLHGDGSAPWFAGSAAAVLALGGTLLKLGAAAERQEPRYRDSLAVVGLAWFLISLAGALPYLFSGRLDFWSAVFESFSGFSSTGATAVPDLRLFSKSLLLWRSFSQWLGGMGIIVLMVAVLPFLGVGGQLMLKNEVSGPSSDKLRPRVAQTAKILWGVYLVLTALLTILLALGGLSFFDALCHSLTTISTGGFSNYNESAAVHQSYYVLTVLMIFMFLGSLSFALYWQALTGRWRALAFNREVIFLAAVVLVAALLSTTALARSGRFESTGLAFYHSLFQAISVVSTTGFSTDDWSAWPSLSKAVIFFLFFVGGCSGSTSGGVKCIRWLLLFKSVNRACRRLIRPRAVFPVRLQGKTIDEEVLDGVWLFLVVYFLTMAVAALALCAMGLDLSSALSAAASALGNVGPALGGIGAVGTYADLPGAAKGLLSLCMLLGRLELYSFLVLFFPEFWSKR
ncbi:MAG: TrkH family potassium uptake protein [Deltaproteobacteria bacterium]|jgi:trk system potassium uptake protein TrkH|nr:TrkH family potassium uptake protein [Deltaproteobacteria bacterium]